jgi:transposase InsO family protein
LHPSIFSAPRSPTTTGKIERFHRTLRAEFDTRQVFSSRTTAQQALDDWVDWYNHQWPHQALGMATPASRFAGHLPSPAGRPADLTGLAPDRCGED